MDALFYRYEASLEAFSNSTTPIPTLPYCHPSNAFLVFVSRQLHTCIPTPLAFLSTLAGVFSIASWLFAQLPQIVTNYKLKSAQSLSFLFLLDWCLGDSANLFGAVLLDQMTFQKLIAAYYVLVDVILVFQWFWYRNNEVPQTLIGRPDKESASDGNLSRPTTPRSPMRINIPPTSIFMMLSLLFKSSSAAPVIAATAISTVIGEDPLRQLGYVLSWSSTFLYLTSRLPQLYLNYKRRSVAGLSPLLFAAAFCGNFFYSSSLLLNPSAWYDIEPFGEGGWVGEDGTQTSTWWMDTLPFLLGSAGVLMMDGCVGWQFLLWGGQEDEEVLEVIVGVEADENTVNGTSRQPRIVSLSAKGRFDERTALLASDYGMYGSSASSSSSSANR